MKLIKRNLLYNNMVLEPAHIAIATVLLNPSVMKSNFSGYDDIVSKMEHAVYDVQYLHVCFNILTDLLNAEMIYH